MDEVADLHTHVRALHQVARVGPEPNGPPPPPAMSM
jgi:hypothetical protein